MISEIVSVHSLAGQYPLHVSAGHAAPCAAKPGNEDQSSEVSRASVVLTCSWAQAMTKWARPSHKNQCM
jgi:hypothetical protein